LKEEKEGEGERRKEKGERRKEKSEKRKAKRVKGSETNKDCFFLMTV
jgi:hypothetical protein